MLWLCNDLVSLDLGDFKQASQSCQPNLWCMSSEKWIKN